MIQINLSQTQKKEIEELHYNAICTNLGKKKSLNKVLQDTFNSKYTLKDFLIGDGQKLQEILEDYKNLSDRRQKEFTKAFNPYFINQYEQKLAVTPKKEENIYKYNNRKYNAYTLCELLNINVCPYCNKNYIVTISDIDNNLFTRPTLDHFLDKATYPFFALSLYNLIPSCHICNSHIKGSIPFDIDTHIHPYFDDFNKIKKFGVDNALLSLVHKKSDFEIAFLDKKGSSKKEKIKAENHIKDLGLETLYSSHKDKVLELIDFSRAYNDDSFKNLVNTFKDSTEIFKDTDDVKRLLIGHHVEDENIDKRPLNKLVKDISDELGLR
ncbi:MAG: Unknown protein [uncultured Sulfurovum sp.]|uniref:HNH domain-containing protein n=1 Tax=uncultured Sulfurovum sp. TaxID=269237 RepID=A0A6S6SG68_9BACT|nr:MAG: Unknown protein [uncultured Sulfurovum sp.]